MWVTNLLTNLFEVIDRFMIVHHSGWPSEEALRQVGNYHSSRILPLLFVSVAVMLGSMITPHLSVDWEIGQGHPRQGVDDVAAAQAQANDRYLDLERRRLGCAGGRRISLGEQFHAAHHRHQGGDRTAL